MDLGASIITGLIGNPIHALCRQLVKSVGLSYRPTAFSSLLHFLTSHGAVYDSGGERVDAAMDERVESGIYNRALAGTDHYRHNCRAKSTQQDTQHKHGIATETANHSHATSHEPPPAVLTTASGQAVQHGAAVYEADRDKLRLSGGWEEAAQMSLRTGMQRAISELNIRMTQQERVRTDTQSASSNRHAVTVILTRAAPLPSTLLSVCQLLYWWLVADLEYSCASSLDHVSMTHWSVCRHAA